MMNLINDAWIPVRRADGTTEKIEPWRLTDHIGTGKSPIVAVASPRPDFDGALTQFLIGLLQTTCTPETESAWWGWRENPPAQSTLRERFATVADAFELEGDKAFMQDAAPSELETEQDIAALLLESPGEQTLKQNKDHFIKRNGVNQLCQDCAAAAIFSLQTNAPSGGQGHRTGLRGGGPLTTLVLGQTLWETCWLNVLEKNRYIAGVPIEHNQPADRFPWLTITRTSEEKPPAGITTQIDVHPDQQFWAMPRRIRLVSQRLNATEPCGLCSTPSMLFFKSYKTKNYGVNYQSFEHPLSPHYIKDGIVSPVHPQPGGIGYRHWLGLIENSTDGNSERRPARVIQQFHLTHEDGRIWAFGYDMDNMKARCWYDATMPILAIDEGLDAAFKAYTERLVQAASLTAGMLRKQIKLAIFGEAEVRGDISFIQSNFWSATEGKFFSQVRHLRDALRQGVDEQVVLGNWLMILKDSAFSIFDTYSQTGDFDATDPRRIALARNELAKLLNGKKLRDLLGLPRQERTAT
jgi:CRISPR system Cascade subunit CasA